MSIGVRNYPRKPLSEKEKTIREALERFEALAATGGSTSPTAVFENNADFAGIYLMMGA